MGFARPIRARDVLLWKLEGLSEHDLRLPRTPTGTNLLGLVKHALNTEVIYFGPTFGREWLTPDELVSHEGPTRWPVGTQRNPRPLRVVDLYRRVQAFADETIDALPLDAIGHVAPGRRGGHAHQIWSTRPRTAAPRGPRRHPA